MTYPGKGTAAVNPSIQERTLDISSLRPRRKRHRAHPDHPPPELPAESERS